MSHEIDEELVEALYRNCLSDLLGKIKSSDFFAIVVDETKDISGKKQLSFCIWWVDEGFVIHEDFIGVHQASKCDAEEIVKIIKNILLNLAIDIRKCRGQTYDGAFVLQGALNGVAVQIRREVLMALGVFVLTTTCNS